MEVSTPKTEGKTASCAQCIGFPSIFGIDTSISPKNITTIIYHFISTLLNADYASFKERGVYCFAHVRLLVCWSVRVSVSVNLVQLITQEGFAPEASNLVGR